MFRSLNELLGRIGLRFNSVGMSLLEILISMTILGILIMGLMTVYESMTKSAVRAQGSFDRIELNTKIGDVLFSTNSCKVTLNDPSGVPLTFKKIDIDNPEAGEGIVIPDLWLSNVDGTARTEMQLSATDINKQRVGKVVVESIKLAMDNGKDFNYAEGPGTDRGNLVVIYRIPGLPTGADTRTEKHPMWVKFTTDDTGLSTIGTCNKSLAGLNEGSASGAMSGAIITAKDILTEAAQRGLIFSLNLQTVTSPAAGQKACLDSSHPDYNYATSPAMESAEITSDLKLKIRSGYNSGTILCTFDAYGRCSFNLRAVDIGPGAVIGFCDFGGGYPIYTAGSTSFSVRVNRDGAVIRGPNPCCDTSADSDRTSAWVEP